eukprot:m.182643 g.182643  ORF g.182643 m.182643 type:complete len:56 (+) comp18068_c2_seq1:49-216(+)
MDSAILCLLEIFFFFSLFFRFAPCLSCIKVGLFFFKTPNLSTSQNVHEESIGGAY